MGNVNYDDAKISYILSVIGNIAFLGYSSFIFIFYLAEFIHDKCIFCRRHYKMKFDVDPGYII